MKNDNRMPQGRPAPANHEIRSLDGDLLYRGRHATYFAAVTAAGRAGALVGADLRGRDLSGINLSGCDLSGMDADGADLYGATLTRARLAGARLCETDLAFADLSWCDMTGVVARGASLLGADLSRALLVGVDLRRATLTGCRWDLAVLWNVDFRGVGAAGNILDCDPSSAGLLTGSLDSDDDTTGADDPAPVVPRARPIFRVINGGRA